MSRLTRLMPWQANSESEPLLEPRMAGYKRAWWICLWDSRLRCDTSYHGLLIAAMPAPLGRMMMLNHLSEQVRLKDGSTVLLSGEERVPHLRVYGAAYLNKFELENGLPVWRYQIHDYVIEKRSIHSTVAEYRADDLSIA